MGQFYGRVRKNQGPVSQKVFERDVKHFTINLCTHFDHRLLRLPARDIVLTAGVTGQ